MARRSSGALAERVLRLLAESERPMSALALTSALRKRGEHLATSLVFRALRQLMARGSVAKVYLARGYTVAGDRQVIHLHCLRCGATLAAGGAPVDAIERAAAAHAFRAREIVCEVPGTCAQCRSRDS